MMMVVADMVTLMILITVIVVMVYVNCPSACLRVLGLLDLCPTVRFIHLFLGFFPFFLSFSLFSFLRSWFSFFLSFFRLFLLYVHFLSLSCQPGFSGNDVTRTLPQRRRSQSLLPVQSTERRQLPVLRACVHARVYGWHIGISY